MLGMGESLCAEGYTWKTGANKVPGMPVPVIYLLGIPTGK
jgi:hypothetical protein